MYDRLASAFELLFPVDLETVRFALDRFPGGEILDLACGSGGYALELAKRGRIVLGVDLSEEMIQTARAKAKEAGLDVHFEVKDMASALGKNRFGGVLFIGNSLVHAQGYEQIQLVLDRVYDSLTDGGILILQILNYDRILKHQAFVLPLIEHEGIRFERRYVPDGEHLRFQTVLTDPNIRIDNEVRLFPIRSPELRLALAIAGFEDVKLHDDFTASPFQRNSTFALVVTARKGRL
jgi:glycine/sarcosine N-methyltransferase